ncbi:MAG: hypothetical protein ACPGRZ_10650 [Alphaproteobacteria bacterium]
MNRMLLSETLINSSRSRFSGFRKTLDDRAFRISPLKCPNALLLVVIEKIALTLGTAVYVFVVTAESVSSRPAYCDYRLDGPTLNMPAALYELTRQKKAVPGRLLAAELICGRDGSSTVSYLVSAYKFHGCDSKSQVVQVLHGYRTSSAPEFRSRGEKLRKQQRQRYDKICRGIAACKIPATYSPDGPHIHSPAGLFNEIQRR